MSNIYGLVVCNEQTTGSSSDRSLYNYHGVPQRYYLYNLLESFCEKVFMSCSSTQAEDIPKEYNSIIIDDEYEHAGDMGVLLTAFKKHPNASFLLIGCTYPYINRHHLKKLTIADLETVPVITYYNKDQEIFTPLIGMYHNNIKNILRKQYKAGDYSMNSLLEAINAYTINAKSPDIIYSVDTQKEYKEVAELFRKFR